MERTTTNRMGIANELEPSGELEIGIRIHAEADKTTSL